MSHYIFRLLSRLQRLDDALRVEQTRRGPDLGRLQRLKQMKRAVKNRLSLHMTGLAPAAAC